MTPRFFRRSCSFAIDQLDACRDSRRPRAGVDGQRAIEIVDDGSTILQQVDDRLVGVLAPLALDPLAVVVELGGLAEQPVLIARRVRAGVRRPRP